MNKAILACAGLALAVTGSAHASEVYDQNLVHGVYYGTGDGLSPENFATVNNNSIELGLRAKLTPNVNGVGQVPTQIDGSNGTYVVPLGDAFNIDFSVDPTVGGNTVPLGTQSITVINELTGKQFIGDPSLFGDVLLDKNNPNGAYQNSEKITFSFWGPNFFDPTLNDTYEIVLQAGGLTDEINVQVGSGFTAAVPEPSTWAMMILGFCGIGFTAYRRKSKLSTLAA
jgi:PEP-CTERM motif